MVYLEVFVRSFYAYSVEILPYFLIAVLITSAVQTFIKPQWFMKALKDPVKAPIYTSLLAGILPLCSCSMLPVANLISGFSRSYAPVMSFLVVAPVISPITLLLTYGYFGMSLTLFRLFGTLFFALLFAYITGFIFKKPPSLPLMTDKSVKSASFIYFLKDNLIGIGKYLMLGIFIASLIKTLIPEDIGRTLSGTPFSYVLIAFISIPIYVCSGEEVPIAKALIQVGFTTGNALTFMLGGTGTCMPTILASLKFLPKGLVLSYIAFWVLFSILSGYIYDILLWKIRL